MGSSFVDGDSTKLKGPDDTEIGNVGDSLKVTGAFGASASPIPSVQLEYKDKRLLDGTTLNMNVNGSSSNKTYKYQPPSGETWYCERLVMLIDDSGTNDPNDFGAISGGITNGLQLVLHRGGVDNIPATFNDNVDIALCFPSQGVSDSSGFLHSADAYWGAYIFKVPIKLVGSDGDYIGLKIRDNLTKLAHLRGAARFWRELP